MKNMACVSLSATHPGTSRKHDARDFYSPQPSRVSFCTSFHDLCKFRTLSRWKKLWLLHARRKPNCKKGKTREPILFSHLACAQLTVIADERNLKRERAVKSKPEKNGVNSVSSQPPRDFCVPRSSLSGSLELAISHCTFPFLLIVTLPL